MIKSTFSCRNFIGRILALSLAFTALFISPVAHATNCESAFANVPRATNRSNADLAAAGDKLLKVESEMVGASFARQMSRLPYRLRQLEYWFGGVRTLQHTAGWFDKNRREDRKWVKRFKNEPSVRLGGDAAKDFFQYRLTPAIIYDVRRGIELLLNRTNPANRARAISPVVFYVQNFNGWGLQPIRQNIYENEIASAPDFPPDAVKPMAKWLAYVATEDPYFIPGYYAEYWAGELIFSKILPPKSLANLRNALGSDLSEAQAIFLEKFWRGGFGIQSVSLNPATKTMTVVATQQHVEILKQGAEDLLLAEIDIVAAAGDLRPLNK